MSIPWDSINSTNLTFAPNLACEQQSATKLVETLCHKEAFWRFPDFKRGKCSFSSPIPSMQCCATVRATFRKQQTQQLWMEGTREGCGFLCSLKLPYLSTTSRHFCRRLKLSNYGEARSEPQENTEVSGKAVHAAVWLLATSLNLYLNHRSDWCVQLRFEFIYPYHAQHKTATTEPLTIPTTD